MPALNSSFTLLSFEILVLNVNIGLSCITVLYYLVAAVKQFITVLQLVHRSTLNDKQSDRMRPSHYMW